MMKNGNLIETIFTFKNDLGAGSLTHIAGGSGGAGGCGGSGGCGGGGCGGGGGCKGGSGGSGGSGGNAVSQDANQISKKITL